MVLAPDTCRQLSRAFYARVARDPVLRPLFPGKSFTCAIEAFAAFLVQFFDGPPEHSQRRWYLSLRESHARFTLTPRHRDAWMKNMVAALDDVALDAAARAALRSLFEHSSAYLVDTVPTGPLDPALAPRWTAQLAVDEAVAAIRAGDAARAIALAETSTRLAALLAQMIPTFDPALQAYVRDKLSTCPSLIHERTTGRTLLHVAAGAGNLAIVELLLRAGADPNAATSGGHPPLYSVANECSWPGGAAIVRALIAAGARVDASGGVKRCTALHMAARRGNCEIAQALLDCGADPEAQDSQGVTPLRRAMNCRQPQVAALLRNVTRKR